MLPAEALLASHKQAGLFANVGPQWCSSVSVGLVCRPLHWMQSEAAHIQLSRSCIETEHYQGTLCLDIITR